MRVAGRPFHGEYALVGQTSSCVAPWGPWLSIGVGVSGLFFTRWWVRGIDKWWQAPRGREGWKAIQAVLGYVAAVGFIVVGVAAFASGTC
jgi:hypothetical protein